MRLLDVKAYLEIFHNRQATDRGYKGARLLTAYLSRNLQAEHPKLNPLADRIYRFSCRCPGRVKAFNHQQKHRHTQARKTRTKQKQQQTNQQKPLLFGFSISFFRATHITTTPALKALLPEIDRAAWFALPQRITGT